MACESGSHQAGPLPVWSQKDTTNWVFHPALPPMDSARHKYVRASIEMAQNSGACKIRPALRMSNDGVTWDTPVAIGSDTRNSNGTTYGNTFNDMGTTTAAKQIVQYGVQAVNDSGTALEMCSASLKIDVKES